MGITARGQILKCPKCDSANLTFVLPVVDNPKYYSMGCLNCTHSYYYYAPEKDVAVTDNLKLFEYFRYGCLANVNTGTVKYEDFELVEPVDGKKKFAVCVLFLPGKDFNGRMNLWETEAAYKEGKSPMYTVWLNSRYKQINRTPDKSWYGLFQYTTVGTEDDRPIFCHCRHGAKDYELIKVMFSANGNLYVECFDNIKDRTPSLSFPVTGGDLVACEKK